MAQKLTAILEKVKSSNVNNNNIKITEKQFTLMEVPTIAHEISETMTVSRHSRVEKVSRKNLDMTYQNEIST